MGFYSTQSLNLYVVRTNRQKEDHHGMRENTAPYVLTPNVGPGDYIEYVLYGEETEAWDGRDGDVSRMDGWAELDTRINDNKEKIIIISHLGRSPSIGEDGCEDAFGHDITTDLWLEVLDGANWNYAPCDIEIIAKPENKEERKQWRKPLKAKLNLQNNYWGIDNSDTEVKEEIDQEPLELSIY